MPCRGADGWRLSDLIGSGGSMLLPGLSARADGTPCLSLTRPPDLQG